MNSIFHQFERPGSRPKVSPAILRAVRGRVLGAILIGTSASLIFTAPGEARKTQQVVIRTYFASPAIGSGGVPHPRRILTGADGRTLFEHLRWFHWGSSAATARGDLREDEGPAGSPIYKRHTAFLHAGRIRHCDGVRAYTRLMISTRAGRGWSRTSVNLSRTYRACAR